MTSSKRSGALSKEYQPYQPTLAEYAIRVPIGPTPKLGLIMACMRVMSSGKNPVSCPTRFFARCMGVSYGNVKLHLKKLRDRGFIDYAPGQRGLDVTVYKDEVKKAALAGTTQED